MRRRRTLINARRPVEAILERVPDVPEAGQAHPARLDGAAARHAVTLALLTHRRGDVLQRQQGKQLMATSYKNK